MYTLCHRESSRCFRGAFKQSGVFFLGCTSIARASMGDFCGVCAFKATDSSAFMCFRDAAFMMERYTLLYCGEFSCCFCGHFMPLSRI